MIWGLASKKTDVATDAGSLGTKQVQVNKEMREQNEMLETKNKQKRGGGGHKQLNNPY